MTEETKKKDLYKNFTQLLAVKDEEDTDMLPEKEWDMYMTCDNVMGIVPKKVWAKKFLLDNFEVDVKSNNRWQEQIGRSKYTLTESNVGEVVESRYLSHYIKIIMDIARKYETVLFRMKKDFPLSVEVDDFILILAPRTGED